MTKKYTIQGVQMVLDQQMQITLSAYKKIVSVFLALSNKPQNEWDLVLVKTGTVLLYEIMHKTGYKKKASELPEADWKEIAESVVDKAMIQDGESYTEYVFDMYADFLDKAVSDAAEKLSKTKVQSIHGLTAMIREKSVALQDHTIRESDYVEDCLFLVFEGMMKIIAASLGTLAGKENSALAETVATLSVQYGRWILYHTENEMLSQFLIYQNETDEKLAAEYDIYIYAESK